MDYFKYPDEEIMLAPATTYIEIDRGGAIRQITFDGVSYLASNVKDNRGSIGLAEGYIDWESLVEEGEITRITKEEFDAIWHGHLASRQPDWTLAIRAYPIGIQVHGIMLIFYPQGVIVDLGDALGVADYNACLASTKPEFMYARHKITAVVSGYDEENQWIKLESPQVHQEVIPL